MFRTLAEATEIPWPYDWVFDWNRGSDTSTFEGVAKPKRRRSTVAKSTTVGLAPMRAKVQKKKKIIFKGRRTSKAASASKPQSHEGKADTAGSGDNVDQAKEPGAGGRGGGESAALVPSRRSRRPGSRGSAARDRPGSRSSRGSRRSGHRHRPASRSLSRGSRGSVEREVLAQQAPSREPPLKHDATGASAPDGIARKHKRRPKHPTTRAGTGQVTMGSDVHGVG